MESSASPPEVRLQFQIRLPIELLALLSTLIMPQALKATSKPGRKLVEDLELTPHRIAQRAFRARRQEKIASLEERVRQLEEENLALLLSPSSNGAVAPSTTPSLDTLLDTLFLDEPDRLFISSHCHFSLKHLSDPSPYIRFCLSLSSFLPITNLGPTSRLSKSLSEELADEQARLDSECCFGMIDCSAPNIIDSSRPTRPHEYMSSSVAWAHFIIFSKELIRPDEVAGMLGRFKTREQGIYGGVVRCDKDLGLLVAKEAVVEVRDEIVARTTAS